MLESENAASRAVGEVWIDGREYVSKDWHGLMAILRDIYPEGIFTGSSGDPGPVILTLVRRVDRLRLNLADVLSTFTDKGHPGYPARRSTWQSEERVRAWLDALRQESGNADPRTLAEEVVAGLHDEPHP